MLAEKRFVGIENGFQKKRLMKNSNLALFDSQVWRILTKKFGISDSARYRNVAGHHTSCSLQFTGLVF